MNHSANTLSVYKSRSIFKHLETPTKHTKSFSPTWYARVTARNCPSIASSILYIDIYSAYYMGIYDIHNLLELNILHL